MFKLFAEKMSMKYHFKSKIFDNYYDVLELSQNFIVRKENSQYLTNFQFDAIRFLFKNFETHQSCVLNDESGLGKTAVICTFLDTVLPVDTEKRILIIVKNENRVVNWNYHISVFLRKDITYKNLYIKKWDSLRTSNFINMDFDCIIVDDRDDLVENKICLAYLLRNFEKRISLFISSKDVTADLKTFHSILRLIDRLDSSYIIYKNFEERFSLPYYPDNYNYRNALEPYFLRREKIINFCRDFRLRRYCHQYENQLPLVEKTTYDSNVKKWQEKEKNEASTSAKLCQFFDKNPLKVITVLNRTFEEELDAEVAKITSEINESELITMSPLLLESDSEEKTVNEEINQGCSRTVITREEISLEETSIRINTIGPSGNKNEMIRYEKTSSEIKVIAPPLQRSSSSIIRPRARRTVKSPTVKEVMVVIPQINSINQLLPKSKVSRSKSRREKGNDLSCDKSKIRLKDKSENSSLLNNFGNKPYLRSSSRKVQPLILEKEIFDRKNHQSKSMEKSVRLKRTGRTLKVQIEPLKASISKTFPNCKIHLINKESDTVDATPQISGDNIKKRQSKRIEKRKGKINQENISRMNTRSMEIVTRSKAHKNKYIILDNIDKIMEKSEKCNSKMQKKFSQKKSSQKKTSQKKNPKINILKKLESVTGKKSSQRFRDSELNLNATKNQFIDLSKDEAISSDYTLGLIYPENSEVKILSCPKEVITISGSSNSNSLKLSNSTARTNKSSSKRLSPDLFGSSADEFRITCFQKQTNNDELEKNSEIDTNIGISHNKYKNKITNYLSSNTESVSLGTQIFDYPITPKQKITSTSNFKNHSTKKNSKIKVTGNVKKSTPNKTTPNKSTPTTSLTKWLTKSKSNDNKEEEDYQTTKKRRLDYEVIE